MSEYRISIVGRARVGKSMLLTRFVNKPEEIIPLSRSGADATKVPTELVLSNDVQTSIEIYEKEDGKKTSISVDELDVFHKRLKNDSDLQKKISHILESCKKRAVEQMELKSNR